MLRSNIKLTFTGDIIMGGELLAFVKRTGINILTPFQSVKTHFIESDFVIINLEGPLYKGKNLRKDSSAIFNNPPEIISFFKEFQRPIFALGNNHIMDYGIDGLKATMDLLRQNDVSFIGAGLTEEEANREVTFTVKNKSISFLSMTANDHDVSSIMAKNEQAGCASYLNIDLISERIKALKKNVDFICTIMHWGPEYYQYPSIQQQSLAHNLIDAGVNLIIGHHPHVVQGIEIYNGSLIAYSLGNFFMPRFRYTHGRLSRQDKLTNEFMILNAEIDDQLGIEHNIIGGNVDNKFQVLPYDSEGQKEFRKKVIYLSAPLARDEYLHFWQKYERKRRIELDWIDLIYAIKKIFQLRLKDLKHLKMNDLKRPLLRIYKTFR